jgi:hypothetical protein
MPIVFDNFRILFRPWQPFASQTLIVREVRRRAFLRATLYIRCALFTVAQPSATACGVGLHLGGHGLRERLRGQNEPAHRTIAWGASGGLGAGAMGRTSTGTTCAISATNRGSSGAQSTPLYSQVPSAYKVACSFTSPRSNRKYQVSPSAMRPKYRPSHCPSGPCSA